MVMNVMVVIEIKNIFFNTSFVFSFSLESLA